MKGILRLAVLTASCVLLPLQTWSQSLTTLTSPNGRVKADLVQTGSQPQLVISDGNNTELTTILLGLTTDTQNFTSLTFQSVTSAQSISEDYTLIHGKTSHATNAGNAVTATFTNGNNKTMKVEVRAWNNGVTFRYILPSDGGERTMNDENTTYTIDNAAHRWLQDYANFYEGDFPYQATGGQMKEWGYPCLFEKDGTFFLITEANMDGEWCGTRLSNSTNSDQYKVTLSGNPKWTGEWTSPWRVVMVGELKDIVESTLVEDVSAPCAVANTDFVHPGSAAWVYWAYNHSSNDYQIVCKYIDLAADMGWPYMLIDWEWEGMSNGGNIENAAQYAQSKGIKPMVWYHSHNGSKMENHNDRIAEFQWLKSIGIVGVKVDFFNGEAQDEIKYHLDILKDAEQYDMLVNFHGCTVPRGWTRTYPHLMSTEAVFGAEQYNNWDYMTENGARINCLLPYTRNIVGPMDYTPVAFTNSQHPHTTSYAHELALSVAFESGIQHWADRPEGFYALPDVPKQHMKEVPTAWDETKFISGYPGQSFVVARRNGERWYVGGLNGTDNARMENVPLSFLGEGKWVMTCIADGSTSTTFNVSTSTVTSADQISVPVLRRGGFVLSFKKISVDELAELISHAQAVLTEAQGNTGNAPGQYDPTKVSALQTALTQAQSLGSNSTDAQRADAYVALSEALENLLNTGNTQGASTQAPSGKEDVTTLYMKEYAGFERSDAPTTRFGTPRYWTYENYSIDEGSDGTKHGIDNFPGYNCLQLGRWEENESKYNDDIKDSRLYQTVTLPAGNYFFGAKYHYLETANVGDNAYIFASTNVPTSSENLENDAFAYATLKTVQGSDFCGIEFSLREEAEVVLGWIMDSRVWHSEFRCSEIRLLTWQPIDLTQLTELINTVENTLANCTIGNNTGNYPQSAYDALNSVLLTVKGIDDNATEDAVEQAYNNLLTAYNVFLSSNIQPAGPVTTGARDVTKRYLIEAHNFSVDGAERLIDRRYGLLAEPWVVTPNVAVMDQYTRGGWDKDPGYPTISIERWGNAPFDNGAIYQTTKTALPAGNYTIQYELQAKDNNETGDFVFMVTRGTQFLDSEKILATQDVSQHAKGDYEAAAFTLTEDTYVTMGWVAHLSNHDYRNIRVRSIHLYKDGIDVSADYLGNYENIQRCDYIANTRYGHPKYWTVENYSINKGGEGMREGIDNYPGWNCLQLGVWNDRGSATGDLANARIYRRITLPAGRYYFGATYNSLYNFDDNDYIFVANDICPTAQIPTQALAYGLIKNSPTGGNDYRGITFTLDAEQEVVLGWQQDIASGSGEQESRINRVILLGYDLPEEDHVTVSSAGYATYLTREPITFAPAVEAYVLSEVGESNVTLMPITSAPAGTPLVVKASEGCYVFDYTFAVAPEDEATIAGNLLLASDGFNADGTQYCLANKSAGVGFYKVNSGVEIPAGRCYVVNSSSEAKSMLSFNEEATGINDLYEEKRCNEIYDLQGRRVTKPTKGVYIVNGNKVLVK